MYERRMVETLMYCFHCYALEKTLTEPHAVACLELGLRWLHDRIDDDLILEVKRLQLSNNPRNWKGNTRD